MEASSFLLPLKPYLEAFTERDPARRLELLAKGLTENAEICGPTRIFTGYAEISEKIVGFHKNWPECRLVLASGVVCFGNAGHLAKAIVNSKGSVLASGHSVVKLAADGRIARVLAFWGPAPALPESWPSLLTAAVVQGSPSAA
jgi:hypothetical protein